MANRSLGSEPLAGSRGRAPTGGQRGEVSLKLKAFCPFSYKDGSNDKDLNERISTKICFVQPRPAPTFGPMGATARSANGGGRPPGRPMPGFANAGRVK